MKTYLYEIRSCIDKSLLSAWVVIIVHAGSYSLNQPRNLFLQGLNIYIESGRTLDFIVIDTITVIGWRRCKGTMGLSIQPQHFPPYAIVECWTRSEEAVNTNFISKSLVWGDSRSNPQNQDVRPLHYMSARASTAIYWSVKFSGNAMNLKATATIFKIFEI